MDEVQIIVISKNRTMVNNLTDSFRKLQPEWRIIQLSSARETEEYIKYCSSIIIDSDLEKNETVNLLNYLNAEYPPILKYLWVDGFNRDVLKEIISGIKGVMPQCIWKQQSESVIADTISRSIIFADWLEFKHLSQVLANMRDIPTVPFVYLKLMNLLNDVDSSVEDIASTVAEDPSLCAKVLKIANSAIIGLREPVSSPFEAIMQLGIERIRAFLLSSRFITQFEQQKVPWFSVERFWNHSMLTASYARQIALYKVRDTRLADSSFTAGILHDVGILIFAANNPNSFREIISTAISNGVPLHVAEKNLLGFTHSELAACLLSTWGLPLSILEAIAAHHNPSKGFSTGFSPLSAVHIANGFANEKHQDNNICGDTALDNEYVMKINCDTQLEEFKKLCFESAL